MRTRKIIAHKLQGKKFLFSVFMYVYVCLWAHRDMPDTGQRSLGVVSRVSNWDSAGQAKTKKKGEKDSRAKLRYIFVVLFILVQLRPSVRVYGIRFAFAGVFLICGHIHLWILHYGFSGCLRRHFLHANKSQNKNPVKRKTR